MLFNFKATCFKFILKFYKMFFLENNLKLYKIPDNIELLSLFRNHINNFKKKILDSLETDLTIYSGIGFHEERTDSIYFKSYSNFSYVCKYNLANSFIVFRKNQKPILYIDGNQYFSFWYKAPEICENTKQIYSVEYYYCDVKEFCTNYHIKGNLICNNYCEYLFKSKDIRINDELVLQLFRVSRYLKTEYEKNCLVIANKITFNVLQKVKAFIYEQQKNNAYISEQCLNNVISETIENHDISFKTIIGFNKNSAFLHYNKYEKKLFDFNQSINLLIDIGIFFNNYSSDITITSSNDTKFNALCDYVNEIKKKLILFIKPGLTFLDVQYKAIELISQCLLDIGVINSKVCELKDLIEFNVYKTFYPHYWGHSLGLNVHDTNEFVFKKQGPERNTGVIKENNIVTVEPGIYFIKPLIEHFYKSDFIKKFGERSVNKELINYFSFFGGVRQESDVIVNLSNCHSITDDVFGSNYKLLHS